MKNNIAFKILSFMLAVLTVCSQIIIPTDIAASDAPDPKSEVRSFIEWKRVRTYDDLPKDNNQTMYMFLAWTSNKKNPNDYAAGDASWCCISPYKKDNSNIQGVYMHEKGYDKIFFVNMDVFITSSPYGMPLITYGGEDGGNGDKPQYYIKLDAGNGDYVMSDGSDHFKFRSNDSHKWGVAVKSSGKKAEGYEKSAEYDGCVCLYYNRDNAYDNGFVFDGDKLTSNKDKDYDDFDPFCMWIGTEKKYTVITENFKITPGNLFNTKDGLVIDNDVSVTVYPGGVFSIEGNVINNGYIRNYGTIVMNPGSAMFPMIMGGQHVGDNEFGSVNANLIECYGAKASVKVPGYSKRMKAEGAILNNGGCLGFLNGRGGLFLRDGSTFENRGLLLTSTSFVIYDSSFLNYARALIGYDIPNLCVIAGYDYMKYPKTIAGVKFNHGLPAKSITGSTGFIFYCSNQLAQNVDGGIAFFRGILPSQSIYNTFFKE